MRDAADRWPLRAQVRLEIARSSARVRKAIPCGRATFFQESGGRRAVPCGKRRPDADLQNRRMTSSDNRIDARDWLLLSVLSVLWGGSFFFVGVAIRELPPLTVVLLRVALAAMVLLPVLWLYRIPLPKGIPGWRPFFAIALLNNVLPFSLIVTGQTYISSGLASILNATTPLFTVLVMAAPVMKSCRRVASPASSSG